MVNGLHVPNGHHIEAIYDYLFTILREKSKKKQIADLITRRYLKDHVTLLSVVILLNPEFSD